MQPIIQKLITNLNLGNNYQSYSLADGTTLDLYFYLNDLTQRIGLNININNNTYIFNNINLTLAQNLLSPLNYAGRLWIEGDIPTISSIDNTSILFYETSVNGI